MTNHKSQYQYPLMENEAESLKAMSGRPLTEITLDSAQAGELGGEDLQIQAETLKAQAQIAHQAGYTQLAVNLTRAAELTAVPNEILLDMYETLRPRRATFAELEALADMLALTYDAAENARFVREAASVYQARGLLRKD
ncbi:MAG: diol dehydratase small subunit [Chloroflexota bacterium]